MKTLTKLENSLKIKKFILPKNLTNAPVVSLIITKSSNLSKINIQLIKSTSWKKSETNEFNAENFYDISFDINSIINKIKVGILK